MARKGRARLRVLIKRVQDAHPQLDARTAIQNGLVRVDGVIVTNPASLVPHDATVAVGSDDALRGEAKLEGALSAFAVDVAGKVALDLGASAGGFTRVLLRAGAERVYAVDVGYGQLVGSLRQDPAVINLERTNISDLDSETIPDVVEILTVDLSYIALARALPQVTARVQLSYEAQLIALIKPMFELALAEPPTAPVILRDACARATAGATEAGWIVEGVMPSPVTGRRGSAEFLLHARRKRE